MSVSLRPYQLAAVDGIFAQLAEHRSTLLVMATGTGKTTVFAECCRRFRPSGRVLVLAHRGELIRQAQRRIAEQTGLVVGVEMADERIDRLFMPDVVVATVQSMQRGRLASFDPSAFGLVVVDEAHHATADTYRSILGHFGSAKVLGVTATPDRGDGEALRLVFESVAHVYEIRDAIEDGYLCRVGQQAVRVEGLDLSKCRTTAGDLNEGDLEKLLMPHVLGVARATMDRAGSRPTMLFGVTVAHAHELARSLNQQRPDSARALDGGSDPELRARTLGEFHRGEFQFLANCALFTEGFDEPSIACVAVARPTKSRAFYTQMVGRGTRLKPSGGDLLILDFQGNAGKHSLVSPLDILDGRRTDDVRERAKKKCDEGKDILTALDEAEHEIGEEKRRRVLAAADVRHSATVVDPFAMVQAFLGVNLSPGRHGGQPPTPEDLAWMADKAHGINCAKLDGGQVKEIRHGIEERARRGLSTWNAARVLIRKGCDPDVSRAEGMLLMGLLAANSWEPTPLVRAAMHAHTAIANARREIERAVLTPPDAAAHIAKLEADRQRAFAAIAARRAA